MRTMGHAVCVASSKIGALISPFVVISNATVLSLGIILGLMNLLASFTAGILPETSAASYNLNSLFCSSKSIPNESNLEIQLLKIGKFLQRKSWLENSTIYLPIQLDGSVTNDVVQEDSKESDWTLNKIHT
jgi:hypothetical protein